MPTKQNQTSRKLLKQQWLLKRTTCFNSSERFNTRSRQTIQCLSLSTGLTFSKQVRNATHTSYLLHQNKNKIICQQQTQSPVGLPNYQTSYQYDPVGNRKTVTENSNATTYTVNNLNQYQGWQLNQFAYDANGNLNKKYAWRYTYDAKNRCVKRVINGMTNYLYYDNWNLIEERDNNGNLLASYVHGEKIDEILTRFTPTQTVYYHHDALGNVSHLTDDVGNLLEHYVYDAFGAPTILNATNGIITTSSYSNRFLFTGREYLPEMGLYDYRNRVYSTEFGRFLQTDPIRFDAKDINLYRYCKNDPIDKKDPDGLLGGGGPGVGAPGKYLIGGVIGCYHYAKFRLSGGNKNNPNNDKETHCLASCQIAKATSDQTAEDLGDLKECMPGPGQNDKEDQQANAAGRDCASDPRGCECCCKEKGY